MPGNLKALVDQLLATIKQSLGDKVALLEKDSNIGEALPKVLLASQFVSDSCLRYPELLAELIVSGDLGSPQRREDYPGALRQDPPHSETELMRQLRLFRRREMLRIAWRDLAGWSDLDETLADLSLLADACISHALDFLYQQACEKKGTPITSKGLGFNLVVIGMGKLGAYELNFSSDIDLIFAFAEDGVLQDKAGTTYGEFFGRLCRSLLRVLSEITVDGFVFRTDIRLRPFGDSGPMIMSFDGMESYYQTQAREWERYAMVKARQVAGDFASGEPLMALLGHFVYRRYLDYCAFEELRLLKLQINQELKRKDRVDNIKLGSGGIREIEFIGQVFQLIRGGKDKQLQIRPIQKVLTILAAEKLLPPDDAKQLYESYRFLRKLENHIQQYQDKQTHLLPTNTLEQQILAYSMSFEDWDSFKISLEQIRSQVHKLFEQVFSVSKHDDVDVNAQIIWYAKAEPYELGDVLKDYGFTEPGTILDSLRAFKNCSAVRRLTAKGAGVLDRLMPQLIMSLSTIDKPDDTLKRMLGLFEAILGRNVYLALLEENPHALQQLLRLVSASRWICEHIAHTPALFDELLDTRTLYEPLSSHELDKELEALLLQIDRKDEEQLMFALRQFKQRNMLKVAAADIMSVIPVMVVSDYLSYIAECLIRQVLLQAWQLLTEKHGYPEGKNDENIGFAIIGFGKLGGLELGYGSDLDLVFLYDSADGLAMTNGVRPIACSQFYGRLAQKIQHIFETNMLSGRLYEVDLRLRPNGESGQLISHINWYEDYLRKQAWTWEHQALVRARFITGDSQLAKHFQAIRQRILCLSRDTGQLKADVRNMREKMRATLINKNKAKFDLKQGKGGIADIEFIVQFGILDQAAKNIALTDYTDNVRLLAGLHKHGFMDAGTAEVLTLAYCTYRDFSHKLALDGEANLADNTAFENLREQVVTAWHFYME
jgi:glutamate-ammonia-ligase adenylyltransferase